MKLTEGLLSFLCCICTQNVVHSSNLLFGPCPRPTNFPLEIPWKTRPYRNFDGQIKVPFAYVVQAKDAIEVVTLANWAYQNGYRIRATGSGHSWSPLIFDFSSNSIHCPKTVLVDTTKHLTSIRINPSDNGRPDLRSVTVGPGVGLQNLLEFLEGHGLGLFASPSISPVTVGGMLAIGAHGTGISSKFDKKTIGHSYGTISNLVVDMTIVAWDNATLSYRLKTLHRSEKDCKALLTSLGRTFITSVTLRVGKNQNLRTQHHFFIPTKELFAHPEDVGKQTRSLQSFTEYYGRTEFVGLPFSPWMWVTTWKAEEIKPPGSREISRPFNNYLMDLFTFLGRITEPILKPINQIVPGIFVRLIGILGHPFLYAGTFLTRSLDLWGPSKNHLLYFSSVTPRTTANGITILTSRENLQLVVSILESHHAKLAKKFAQNNEYPNLFEMEIRVGGLDNPGDVEIPGSESPSLSPASPSKEFPDYNIIIWMEGSGFPESGGINDFYTQLQFKIFQDIDRKFGLLRAEWAKAWAYSDQGPWKNSRILREIIPRSFSSSDNFEEWNWAVTTLNFYDPLKIFSTKFLDELLVVH